MTKASSRRLDAFDQCLRRILHIPYIAHITNEEVRRRIGQGRGDGGISVYVPPKSVYLKNMWLFFSCDPGQIRYDICSRVGH